MVHGRQTAIGVLGGTFDPVHHGHLVMAQDAAEHFGLRRVLLMPCALPPHKSARRLTSGRHRLAMLRAAVAGDRRFSVSALELERRGVSYSVETVAALRARHPAWQLTFIIGSDTLGELHGWREVNRLLGLCRIVTVERPGFPLAKIAPRSLRLEAPWPRRLLRDAVRGHLFAVTASDIRRRVAAGQSIRYLVPPAVETYIETHRLYREEPPGEGR